MPSSVDAKRLVRERAAARRRAVQRIRRTVLVVSVTLFIALFSTIYVQLAEGRDPALTAVTSTSTSSSSGSDSTGTSSSSNDDAVSDDSASDESADQPSAVTTTQS